MLFSSYSRHSLGDSSFLSSQTAFKDGFAGL